jgi:hypothetical protein
MVNSSTIVLTNYNPISTAYGPDNLITHLNNRSLRWDVNPRIDALNNRATYNSCFRVAASEFKTGPYIIGLDHGRVIIQNSVLLVQDQLKGWINYLDNTYFDQYYASQWEVYIGDSTMYSENPKCPGGPHLSKNYDDYHDE